MILLPLGVFCGFYDTSIAGLSNWSKSITDLWQTQAPYKPGSEFLSSSSLPWVWNMTIIFQIDTLESKQNNYLLKSSVCILRNSIACCMKRKRKVKYQAFNNWNFSIVVSEVLLSNCKYYVRLIEFSWGPYTWMHISAECQNKPFSMSVCFNILLAFSKHQKNRATASL